MTEPSAQRHHLADVRTAVYRFYDADDQLLYLGISHNLEERWATHERIQPWWLDVVRREFTWYDSRAEAEDVEQTATAAERPRYDRSSKRTAGGEVERRLEVEKKRAMEAVSADIANGTYPLWRVLPSYPELSRKYGIPIVGMARGLASLAFQDGVLVYRLDLFAVSRPGCTPSRDAQAVGMLYFLASNAFGDSTFTLTDLAETTGYGRATAYQHVKRWLEAGRAECLGPAERSRALIYRIARHPEPDPPQVLTYWQSDDVQSIADWLDRQITIDADEASGNPIARSLIERDREIIAACRPGKYGVSEAGVRVLKVLARQYQTRPGCLPEWGVTEGAAS